MSADSTNDRMARVLRVSISDPQVLDSLSERDVRVVAQRAMTDLASSDIRGFVYRCFTAGDPDKAMVVVDETVAHAARLMEEGDLARGEEIVSAAVGALSMLSASDPAAESRIFGLLEHPSEAVVVSVVESIGHSSNMDRFARVCDLLLSDGFAIQSASIRYVEECTRDAAFRRREGISFIEDDAEEFLRRALVPLESAYRKLGDMEETHGNTRRRLSILVAMIYNEILDSTDWKRLKRESVDERIYYTLEQHLNEDIAPIALPCLFKMLPRADVEEGIKRSALNTVGRMGKLEQNRRELMPWLETYEASERSERLAAIARTVREAYEQGRQYSSIPPSPGESDRPSIVPRAAGAPLPSQDEDR